MYFPVLSPHLQALATPPSSPPAGASSAVPPAEKRLFQELAEVLLKRFHQQRSASFRGFQATTGQSVSGGHRAASPFAGMPAFASASDGSRPPTGLRLPLVGNENGLPFGGGGGGSACSSIGCLEDTGLALTMGAMRFGYFYGEAQCSNFLSLQCVRLVILSLVWSSVNTSESPSVSIRVVHRRHSRRRQLNALCAAAGGDGECIMKFDLRNAAASVRERSAVMTAVLLPLKSLEAEMETAAPTLEERRTRYAQVSCFFVCGKNSCTDAGSYSLVLVRTSCTRHYPSDMLPCSGRRYNPVLMIWIVPILFPA